MPRPTKGARLGSGPAHQKLLLGGLATSLFIHDRVKTTEAKAKALRPVAEKLITFAKRGDVSARREVLKVVTDRDVVHRLFAEIGPRYAERDGGYTRILKLGPRKGDGAPMAQIELLDQDADVRRTSRAGAGEDEVELKQRRGIRGRLGRKGGKAAKSETASEEPMEEASVEEAPAPVDEAPEAEAPVDDAAATEAVEAPAAEGDAAPEGDEKSDKG